MKLEFKQFYCIERPRYRVVKQENYPQHKKQRMCVNCRHLIYNRLSKAEFCAHHMTPVNWFELCAYFNNTWYRKL